MRGPITSNLNTTVNNLPLEFGTKHHRAADAQKSCSLPTDVYATRVPNAELAILGTGISRRLLEGNAYLRAHMTGLPINRLL